MQRAGAAGVDSTCVLDLVAVVGVVGEDRCQQSAEATLSKADCPHVNLRKLFLERRFVFFHCTPMMPAGVAVLLGYGGHYIGSVQVPEGVLEVWEWAFLSNSELNVEKQTPACHSRVVGKNVARARFRVIR